MKASGDGTTTTAPLPFLHGQNKAAFKLRRSAPGGVPLVLGRAIVGHEIVRVTPRDTMRAAGELVVGAHPPVQKRAGVTIEAIEYAERRVA